MKNRLGPDPCYQHPGYIDVLIPPPLHNNIHDVVSNSKRDGSDEVGRPLLLRRPSSSSSSSLLVSTLGYDIEQCDRERWIHIDASSPPVESTIVNSNKKRKRACQSLLMKDCSRGNNDDDNVNRRRHVASWKAFRTYLEECTPVKIQKIALFRDGVGLANVTREDATSDNHQRHDGDDYERGNDDANIGNNNENGGDVNMVKMSAVLSSGITALPSVILDSIVTVQCAFPPSSDRNNNNTGDGGSIPLPTTPQEIDNAVSFSNNNKNNNNKNNIPTFMGQEDQVTTEMTLREVITWGETHAVEKRSNDSTITSSSSPPSMALCVAQEPIVTADDESSTSPTTPAMGRQESKNNNSNGQYNNKCIHILADGTVKQFAPKVPSNDDITAMSHLSRMLRLPSHLLLGDPSKPREDDNSIHHPNNIVIHNVNLWYAPQTCCTNVHYDERDNLLLVTEGLKVVELCPPGCIRGSGIYSDHANHPALLRRRRVVRGYDVDDNDDGDNDGIPKVKHYDTAGEMTSAENKLHSEIEMTRHLKRTRTHIVPVSAGEGLYIPAGWWHRVESSSSTVAVNVWFDYNNENASSSSRTTMNVPSHMVPFRLRHSARKYYEVHAEYATNTALERCRRDAIAMTGGRTGRCCDDVQVEESKCSIFLKKEWILLEGMTFVDFASMDEIRVFSDVFTRCWSYFMDEVDASAVVEDGLIREIIRRFKAEIEYFLLFVDLADALQVRALVRMWTRFPPLIELSTTDSTNIPSIVQSKSKLFTTLILGFSPETCFIITNAWERHALLSAGSSCVENESEVESSYKHFFELVGNENEKQVRSYLMNSVEDFRCKTCQSYLMEGILLGKF